MQKGTQKHEPEMHTKNEDIKTDDNPGQSMQPKKAERFTENTENDQEQNTFEVYTSGEDHLYYIPADKLDQLALIQLEEGLESKTKLEKKSTISRNSLKKQSPVFFKAGKTSPEVLFSAIFDNDMFDYTDYYYTSGIGFEFYHPAISSFPLVQVLPGLKYGVNYYGITLTHNLYTPRNLIYDYVLDDDRPFAAYLVLGHQRISLSPENRRRLKSELSLGMIGPSALGGAAQDLIHDDTPIGWANQVQNDFIINYNLRFDQGIVNGRNTELAIAAGGQAGTLYDNISAGLFFQAGNYNSRYASIFQTTAHQKSFKKRIRYFFSLEVMNKMVFYDATLQGGMFNRESAYTLRANQVRHYVLSGTATAGLGFGRYSLEAEQVILTPEFKGGLYHMWFRIKNIIYLN